jgi:hypothetical protein
MNVQTLFFASSYLLIALGLVGLALTGELSAGFIALAVLTLLLGVAGETRERKIFLPAAFANVLIVGVFLYTLVTIFIFRDLPLQSLAHFLLALQAVKLAAPKRARDWAQLYLLSFFSVVAASALSVEFFFAVIFACYLFLAPWVLILFHLRCELERNTKESDAVHVSVGLPLFRLVAGVNVVLLILTLFFFVTMPRLGVGLGSDWWASGSAVTGFSDRLTLGDVARIQKNGAVAMRVSFAQQPPGEGDLYWRGIALDLFDGFKWQRSRFYATPIRPVGGHYSVGGDVSDRQDLIQQKVILEPNGSPALFSLGRPVTISGRLGQLFSDPLGNIHAFQPYPFQISYEVVAAPELGKEQRALGDGLLELPREVDPRVLSLADRVTEGLSTPMEKARALERHLRGNYGYSLEDLPVGVKDPLAAFLFDVRQGNCEYFASTLAVMLRGMGIPAQVVNGYLGGEWNAYGEYYVVRQSNAHSWVEAYLPDEGWVRLDPTPPRPAGRVRSLLSSVTNFADFLQFRWYRYVVNYGLADQYSLFRAASRPHLWFTKPSGGLSWSDLLLRWPRDGATWLGLFLALGCLAWGAVALVRSRRRLGAKTAPSLEATVRYRRFLALMRRKGLRKAAGETADEFSSRAAAAGVKAAREFAGLYQESRFSAHPRLANHLRQMDRMLDEMRR